MKTANGKQKQLEQAQGEPVNRIEGVVKPTKRDTEQLTISALRQTVILIPIVGETPLKILRFSEKNKRDIMATQEAGSQAKKSKKRDPKDFEKNYEEAKYICTQVEQFNQERDAKAAAQGMHKCGTKPTSSGGATVTWLGLNASGVRNGAIETCRMTGFAMTRAKMSIFCLADGRDDIEPSIQLVRVFGEPKMSVDPVRNTSGVIDLRARVMFEEWRMNLRIRFDEDQFSPGDIVNLMVRVGQQNGLGEGRPNSTNGNGCDNGIFVVDFDEIKILSRTDKPPVFQG